MTTADPGRTTRSARDGREVVVSDRPGAARFDAVVDGTTAAHTDYHRPAATPERIVVVHTETATGWTGQAIATALVDGSLELIRSAGLRLVPRCPFYGDYLSRHPEHADLVDDADRDWIRPAPSAP